MQSALTESFSIVICVKDTELPGKEHRATFEGDQDVMNLIVLLNGIHFCQNLSQSMLRVNLFCIPCVVMRQAGLLFICLALARLA